MSPGIPELVWRAYMVNLFVYSELTLRFCIKSGRRCGTAERGKRRRNLLPPGASDVDVVDGAGSTNRPVQQLFIKRLVSRNDDHYLQKEIEYLI